MIHLVREHQRRLHQILYCRFVERHQTVELDGKGETAVLIDFISADSNTQEPFHTLNLLELQRHYDVATDSYITDSSFIDLTTVLSKRIGELMFNLIYEVEETTSGKTCQQIMVGLTQVLREFSTFVLEKDFNRILDTHPNHWHLQLLNGVSGPITNYISQKSILGNPEEVDYIGFNIGMLYGNNILNVVTRIGSVVEALDISDAGSYQPRDNGHFLYFGKNQESAIRSFLSYKNDGLVPKDQVEDWVGFLSGKSFHSELTWLGRKKHLSVIFALARESKLAKRVTPIEPVHSQVQRLVLAKMIRDKSGDFFKADDFNRSYNSILPTLKTTAKYIDELFSSYNGME